MKDELELTHEGNKIGIGHACVSARMKGLKGFFCALAILIVSIATCGCIQHSNEKRYHSGKEWSQFQSQSVFFCLKKAFIVFLQKF